MVIQNLPFPFVLNFSRDQSRQWLLCNSGVCHTPSHKGAGEVAALPTLQVLGSLEQGIELGVEPRLVLVEEGLCRPSGPAQNSRSIKHSLGPQRLKEQVPSPLASSESSVIHGHVTFLLIHCSAQVIGQHHIVYCSTNKKFVLTITFYFTYSHQLLLIINILIEGK